MREMAARRGGCRWSLRVRSDQCKRDELLNETLFGSLAHARAALAEWRLDYNTVRPHSSLGNLPPVDYAKLSLPASQRDGTLHAIGGSAPRPFEASSQVFAWREAAREEQLCGVAAAPGFSTRAPSRR